MEVFGLMGFVLALFAIGEVSRLKRILRENDIRPLGGEALSGRLLERVGQSVDITLYAPDGTTTKCRVVDVDEEWARVIRDEGKRNQRELLIRLCDVKQVKG